MDSKCSNRFTIYDECPSDDFSIYEPVFPRFENDSVILSQFNLLNSHDKDDNYFICDYCKCHFHKKDLYLSTDHDTQYELKAGILGRAVMQKTEKVYWVNMCPRCHKVHTIAGRRHFVIHLILIILAIYLSWKDGASYDYYTYPVFFAVLIAQGIRFIDWFFIKLFFKVRRKPDK